MAYSVEDYLDDMEEVEPFEEYDLDPHRTATYLDNGVPYCYMGHAHCYDRHESERLADEADWEAERDAL